MDLSNRPLFFSWRQAILESSLSPTTRHVLLTLGCHMNDLGESCYPSTETLARETGLSKVAIIKHLTLAVELKWIVKSVHGYSGQGWRRNQYSIGRPVLDPEAGKPSLPPSDQKVVNVESKGGKPESEKVVNDVNLSTSKNTSKSTSDIKPSARFAPPTLAEVQNYMAEIEMKNAENVAGEFIDHYQARGWKPKGYTTQMKDWRAAVRTWKRHESKFEERGRNGFPNKAEERSQHNSKVLGDFLERQGSREVARSLLGELPATGR